MDNKGRVTVVLHWDQRHQNYRGSGHTGGGGGMDTSPSKRTMPRQQNGAGGLLMEHSGALKREPNQMFQKQQSQSTPNVYRHGSTPQITVIHHDAIPPPKSDSSSKYYYNNILWSIMIISSKYLKFNDNNNLKVEFNYNTSLLVL